MKRNIEHQIYLDRLACHYIRSLTKIKPRVISTGIIQIERVSAHIDFIYQWEDGIYKGKNQGIIGNQISKLPQDFDIYSVLEKNYRIDGTDINQCRETCRRLGL